MSSESIEDLLMALPPRLRARRGQLEALLAGRLSDGDRDALEREAEQDEDLAYALMLFQPFDAEEMAGVEAKVASALTPEAAPAGPPEPANDPDPPRGLRGRWLVVGLLAAAAAVVLAVIPKSIEAPYRVQRISALATAPDAPVRLELSPRRAGLDHTEATVLAVARDTVHRAQVPLRRDGDRLLLEAEATALTGDLYGVVELLVLSGTDTDPEGLVAAEDVRTMMKRLEKDGAATRLVVQPPEYTLAVAAEGTQRAVEGLEAVTASTAVEVPGRVVLNLRPAVRAEGALELHAFVARDGAAPEPLEVKMKTRRGAFLVETPTARVMQDADDAVVVFFVGPADRAPPAFAADPGPPWQRIAHRLYRRAR